MYLYRKIFSKEKKYGVEVSTNFHPEGLFSILFIDEGEQKEGPLQGAKNAIEMQETWSLAFPQEEKPSLFLREGNSSPRKISKKELLSWAKRQEKIGFQNVLSGMATLTKNITN